MFLMRYRFKFQDLAEGNDFFNKMPKHKESDKLDFIKIKPSLQSII